MDNGPFDSNEELRGVFADPRLSQWRHSVPEASNRASRVNFTIAKLLDDWNADGENALYLFLVVVSEQTEKSVFADLAEEVRVGTIQDKITACQQELKQIAEHLARGWSDPMYAATRKAKVEEELRQWGERLKATTKGNLVPRNRVVIEEQRRIDAAIPESAYVDQEIRLAVQVKLMESPLLNVGDFPVKLQKTLTGVSEAVILKFPINQFTGEPAPAHLIFKIDAPSFTIKEPEQEIEVQATRDSNIIWFILRPQQKGTLAVNVKIYDKHNGLVGTIPLQTSVGIDVGSAVTLIANLFLRVLVQPAPYVMAAAENGPTPRTSPLQSIEAYTDIELHIFGKTDDVYPVKAELSDGSSFSGEMRLDKSTRQGLALDGQPESEALSQALFTGEMEKAYLRAETLAETTTGGRLRLRLWIDTAAAELQALRWERLHYQRNQKSFRLATAAHRPFSRYFGLGQADPEPLTARPIRLLAVLANPRNLAEYALAPLDVENEIASLLDALAPFLGSAVELTLLAGRTALPAALQGRLAQKSCRLENEPASLDALFDLLAHPPDYHILHFLGHGAYSGRRKQAALYFEDQVGNAQIVSDKSLTEGLHDVGQIPHLVFLAACDSAKREADANPFVGLAPRLIQVGVPAVVAMQDTISLANARALTRHFYRFLFEHGIVDKAINQARRALVKDETQEYAIPALFTRLKAGRLFNFTVTVAVSVVNSTPIQPPPTPSSVPAFAAADSPLEMAKRTLEILERQAAAYTALTIPAHLQIELEEQRKKVAALASR